MVVAVTEVATGFETLVALRNAEGVQEKFMPDVGVALNWLEPLKQIAAGFAAALMMTDGKTLTPMVVDEEHPSSVPVTPYVVVTVGVTVALSPGLFTTRVGEAFHR